ncbi:MAG TPA: TolC family protein [Polyangiaceae bacterium]
MWKSSPRATLVASLLALPACASAGGPSYDALRADVDRTAPLVSRTSVEDERALTEPVLDRAAYVRAVLDRNLSVDEARMAWRAAVARTRESGAPDDPTVTLGIAPLSIGSSTVPLGYSAEIAERLPWPGKLAFEESAAKAEALAARSDFEATRRELALSASLLYDQYFIAVRSTEINAQHVALMKELKAGALAQFENGRASAQDPLQAEAELTHMEHDAVTLASDRDVAVAQMNELLHRDPSAPLPPPARDLVLPDASPVGGSDRLETEAATTRPEIEAARMHAQAEEARARRAERDSYPDVTVSTSYNSMWATPEHRWMVGLGFDLPIVLGRRAGAVEEANAARGRYESEAARLTDRARTEVAVAMRRLEEARHVVRLYENRLLPVARDQIDAARAGFVSSRNDFVAVVGAERNLRSVELSYQMARADVDRRQAELDRAVGRVPGLDAKEASR